MSFVITTSHPNNFFYWIKYFLIGLIVLLSVRLGGFFTLTPSNICVFWPANAILLASLMLLQKSERKYCLGIAAIFIFMAELWLGYPPLNALIYTFANIIDVSIVLAVLNLHSPEHHFLKKINQLPYFLGGITLGAVVGACIGTITVFLTVPGVDFISTMLGWTISVIIGYQLLTPLILTFHIWKTWQSKQLISIVLLILALVAFMTLAFYSESIFLTLFLFISIIPLLTLGALKFHLPGSVLTSFTVGLLLLIWSVSSSTVLPGLEQDEITILFQLVCVVISVTFIVLAILQQGLVDKNQALIDINLNLENIVDERTRDLKTAMNTANNANRAKSEFLANISHEIRTPMNSVLGYTEILKKIENDTTKSNYIENIHTSGKSLLNLINDILDLSKIEAGKIELKYSAVSIQRLLDEMNSIFIVKCQEKDLDLEFEIAEEIPSALMLEETRLRQVLINTVGNAIKYTEKGFVKIRVEADFLESNDEQSLCNLFIHIQDSGVGIPKDQQQRIFENFVQLGEQNISGNGGTGLGLAITNRLLDMMNAEISVQSELGKGSIFSIKIKNCQLTSKENLKNEEALHIDISKLNFKKARILIADDIAYNREVLSLFLKDFEFEIQEAVNGVEVLKMVKEQKPDLIFLDIRMPILGGYETAQKLKKDPKLNNIPIIAVTASALKEDEDIISAICDSYIRKPIQGNDIYKVLVQYLEQLPEKVADRPYHQQKNVYVEEKIKYYQIQNKAMFEKQLTELLALNENLKDYQEVKLVEKFAEKCISMAIENDIKSLMEYGNELKLVLKRFDIENMLLKIHHFEKMVLAIKKNIK